jgi:hypothetical protein
MPWGMTAAGKGAKSGGVRITLQRKAVMNQ